MPVTALRQGIPQDVYASLMDARRGHPLEDTLARMLASWMLGMGFMPEWLGLGEENFQRMMRYHFPAYEPARIANSGRPLDPQRNDEIADLRRLLMENRTLRTASEGWMADMVVAGCLGNDHLWQDLGLWSRSDLSALMMENFQPLAIRNEKDMKWKKFLYLQLCATEGIYTCRAPSCEVCVDYQNCFGREE